MAIKLIVGLGNNGKDYSLNRHNVGFWFIDKLAELSLNPFKKESKFNAKVLQTTIAKNLVFLLKPNGYINLSGSPILSFIKFYKINPEEILIIHDDIDIKLGDIKIKFGGGHSGHNGLKDIIKTLKSKDFYRLRIGVGRPINNQEVVDFVLNNPSKAESTKILNSISRALDIIDKIITKEIDEAMNILHSKTYNILENKNGN
jgi:PTH1 family peptidyl-tRNA hydrolase